MAYGRKGDPRSPLGARAMRALDQAERFLSTLMMPYHDIQHAKIEIRCLSPRGAPTDIPPPRRWYGLGDTLDAATDCVRFSTKFDVYVGVNPRFGEGKARDILWSACLWQDVDGSDAGPDGAYALIRSSGLPPPQIAVTSGGGVHAYWSIWPPVYLPDDRARDDYKALVRRLALKIGGEAPACHADTTAADVARILRVPGCWNHKIRDHPRPVLLTRCLPDSMTKAMSYEQWLQLLPPEPPRVYHRTATRGLGGVVSDGIRNWANRPVVEGQRHHSLVAAAAWLVRDKGLTKEQAEELVAAKAQASPGRRTITDRELRDIVQWA